MKNETARREIESLDYYLQNHTDDYSEESHTAMMMAVKALDQEPCETVLGKIRAEIDQITDTMGVSYNQYVSKIDVLQIIDKYKEEARGKA